MHLAAAPLAAIAAGLALSALAQPVAAAPTARDHAFVEAFGAACVPGRLTYESTLAAVAEAGWAEVGPDANPELDSLMQIAEREATTEDELLRDPTFDATLFGKDVAGRPHFLVVTRTSSNLAKPTEPDDIWSLVGCYLYDFDATTPVDPAPVGAFVGQPIAQSVEDQGVVSHVWGPPCPMPRTGDTYLTFIAAGSAWEAQTGFSGQVLKFDTSELDPGEPEPAPYC